MLVIEEREGKIIRLIFHWYVYGDENGYPHSFYKIAEKLTAMGIPSPGMTRGHYQKKSAPVVVHRHAPFFVVVLDHEWVVRPPRAAIRCPPCRGNTCSMRAFYSVFSSKSIAPRVVDCTQVL